MCSPTVIAEVRAEVSRRRFLGMLGAAGTLERVLIANHDAHDARLLYASVLCRLDDAAGARVELSLLRGQDVSDPAWAEVTAACGALPRPQIQPEGGQ